MSDFTFDHEGRVVVITGGGSGIGRGMALAFSKRGACVLVCGRREPALRDTADLNPGPGQIIYMTADVTEHEHMKRVAAKAVEQWGRLDVWINNAGVLERGELPESDAAHLDHQMQINVTGTYNGCRAALTYMQPAKLGCIINVSSYLSEHAGATGTLPAYAATKGAVNAMSRTLAVRHGADNIRINTLCPALVPTELNSSIYDGVTDRQAKDKEMGKRYPIGRIGTPEDVAAAAIFLASDEAGWITGQALFVDGGISAQ